MTHELLRSGLVVAALALQALIVALSTSLFIKNANHHRIVMTDVLYLIASAGFFGLMLLFIWACEKV